MTSRSEAHVTPAERRALEAAAAHVLGHRTTPTCPVLMAALGVEKTRASQLITQLRRKGLWPYPPGRKGRVVPVAEPAPLPPVSLANPRTRACSEAMARQRRERDRAARHDVRGRKYRAGNRTCASLDEWRRRAWPVLFGIDYRPGRLAPVQSSIGALSYSDPPDEDDD